MNEKYTLYSYKNGGFWQESVTYSLLNAQEEAHRLTRTTETYRLVIIVATPSLEVWWYKP